METSNLKKPAKHNPQKIQVETENLHLLLQIEQHKRYIFTHACERQMEIIQIVESE